MVHRRCVLEKYLNKKLKVKMVFKRALLLLSASVLIVFAKEIPINEDGASVFGKCPTSGNFIDVVNCMSGRALKVMDEAANNPKIEILPGITFVSENPNIQRSGKSLEELPTDPKEKAAALVDRLFEATSRLISGRSLNVKLPYTESKNVARALEEGRAKIKKLMGPLLLGIGTKVFGIMPIVIGGVALLASKALIVAKIAFLIAIALAFPTFFSSGAGNFFNKVDNCSFNFFPT